MIFHKFPSIRELHEVSERVLSVSMAVTEKMDGANFRFRIWHPAHGRLPKFGSRELELDNIKELAGDSSFFEGRPVKWVYEYIIGDGVFNEAFDNYIGLSHITVYGEWIDPAMTRIPYNIEGFLAFEVRLGIHDENGEREEILDFWPFMRFCAYVGLPTVPFIAQLKNPDLSTLQNIIKMKSRARPSLNMEGIVITPLKTILDKNGRPIRAKLKSETFCERKRLTLEEKAAMTDAAAFSHEWVTENRLINILSHGLFKPTHTLKDLREITPLLLKDIEKDYGRPLSEDQEYAVKRNVLDIYKKVLENIRQEAL